MWDKDRLSMLSKQQEEAEIKDGVNVFKFYGSALENMQTLMRNRLGDLDDERIIPPDRQGLTDILKEMGATEYDRFTLLIHNNAVCQRDNLYIREVMKEYENYETLNRSCKSYVIITEWCTSICGVLDNAFY